MEKGKIYCVSLVLLTLARDKSVTESQRHGLR
jgi:hypothetical protein